VEAGKGKGTAVPVQAMMAYAGGGQIQHHSFVNSALDGGVVNFTSWLFSSRRKSPRYHWIGGE
jgi:hypothetical protein